MEPEHNEYETRCNEETFLIRGQEVCLLSPTIARVTIQCPFPATNHPTEEQKTFVMRNTQSVVNYMLTEGIMSKTGVGIMVLTNHPKQ